MHPFPIELTNDELATARGGFDIGGLLNSAFGMAQQAGAPTQELGMAKKATSMAMPLLQSFLGGGGGGSSGGGGGSSGGGGGDSGGGGDGG